MRSLHTQFHNAARRAPCGLLTAIAAILLVPALLDPRVPAWERLAVAAFAAAAALTPRQAMLVLVAGIPLGFLAPPVSGSPFRLTEAIIVAAIAGWSTRAGARNGSRTIPSSLWTPALLTGVLLGCSAVVAIASTTAVSPRAMHESVVQAVRNDYFFDAGVLDPAGTALMQLEALALFVAAAAMAIQAPPFVASVARMLIVGAAAMALLNLQRFAQIVLRSDATLDTAPGMLRHLRINVSYGDVNAAGSFFTLAGVIGTRLSFTRSRAEACLGAAATAAIVAALWLTGSRAAVAAFLLASMGLLLTFRPSRGRTLAIGAGVVACAAATILFVALFPNRAAGSGISLGWLTRIEMAKVSLRMTSDHPWFGVGVGRFYDASAQYLPSTRLADVYPQENAHNNYLQVLAEVGILGGLALLWLSVASVRYALAGVRDAGPPRIALVAGLAAFAATMLLGHPLLTPEVCYVFALAAGVTTGAGVDADRRRTPAWIFWAAAAAMLALVASVPPRIHSANASANMDQVAWGTGPWQTGPDGVKARAMRTQTTLFVPTRATVIEIPVRLDRPGSRVVLSVKYRDHDADDLVVASTSWTRYRLIIGGGTRPDRRYEPVVLTPKSGDAENVRLGKIVDY